MEGGHVDNLPLQCAQLCLWPSSVPTSPFPTSQKRGTSDRKLSKGNPQGSAPSIHLGSQIQVDMLHFVKSSQGISSQEGRGPQSGSLLFGRVPRMRRKRLPTYIFINKIATPGNVSYEEMFLLMQVHSPVTDPLSYMTSNGDGSALINTLFH